jgi:Ca2+-binding RTX toxin-like protein
LIGGVLMLFGVAGPAHAKTGGQIEWNYGSRLPVLTYVGSPADDRVCIFAVDEANVVVTFTATDGGTITSNAEGCSPSGPQVTCADVGFLSANGGEGADALDASGSNARVPLTGGAGDDILDGGRGDDVMHGGAGNDGLYADERDRLVPPQLATLNPFNPRRDSHIDCGDGTDYVYVDPADPGPIGCETVHGP